MESRNEKYMLSFALKSARHSYKAAQESENYLRRQQQAKRNVKSLREDRELFSRKRQDARRKQLVKIQELRLSQDRKFETMRRRQTEEAELRLQRLSLPIGTAQQQADKKGRAAAHEEDLRHKTLSQR